MLPDSQAVQVPALHTSPVHQDPIDSMMKSFMLSLKAKSIETPPRPVSDKSRVDNFLAPPAPIEPIETECTNPTDCTQFVENAWAIDTAELPREQLSLARDSLISAVPYITINRENAMELHNILSSRRQVHAILPYFHHLRLHLRATTTLLNRHNTSKFSQFAGPAFNSLNSHTADLATSQILFMHHHCAVSETLASLKSNLALESFGLPLDCYEIRHARNYFCHGLLTPGGGMWWKSTVRKMGDVHERLLRQVDATIPLLEGWLADESVWYEEFARLEEVGEWGSLSVKAVGSENGGSCGGSSEDVTSEEDMTPSGVTTASPECSEEELVDGYLENGPCNGSEMEQMSLSQSEKTDDVRRWSMSNVIDMKKSRMKERDIWFLSEPEYEHLQR